MNTMIFFSRLISRYGVNTLYNLTNAVQDGILVNFLEGEGDALGFMNQSQLIYKPVSIISMTDFIHESMKNNRLTQEAFALVVKGCVECLTG